jgi:ABC-2 type transport system permease protein
MAVYKRSYKAYTGHLTPRWSRMLVLPRYAWRGMFKQRLVMILFVICFFYPVGCALAIYLNSNMAFLSQYVPVPKGGFLNIGNQFFFILTSVQCTLGFLLTTFVGPGLVSPDLVNNALPLYFCRPLARWEYVVGKMLVILGLLSFITWIPGLMLFGLQASLADGEWFKANYWIAGSMVASSWLWMLLIAVLALALSAWVRWKILAGGLMLVVLFLGAGIAQTIREVVRTDAGGWFDPLGNISRVWMYLFDIRAEHAFSTEESAAALVVFVGLCVYLLARKVRAYEVVRG